VVLSAQEGKDATLVPWAEELIGIFIPARSSALAVPPEADSFDLLCWCHHAW
jgi:hypothetical protein